jgi:hypothetical protein
MHLCLVRWNWNFALPGEHECSNWILNIRDGSGFQEETDRGRKEGANKKRTRSAGVERFDITDFVIP